MKLRNDERRLTVMVISKDAGAYSADNLPSGNWEVQAVGGDIESTWSQPVSLTNAGTGETNIAMTEFRKPDLAAAWPRRMPEELASIDSLPERARQGHHPEELHLVPRCRAHRRQSRRPRRLDRASSTACAST